MVIFFFWFFFFFTISVITFTNVIFILTWCVPTMCDQSCRGGSRLPRCYRVWCQWLTAWWVGDMMIPRHHRMIQHQLLMVYQKAQRCRFTCSSVRWENEEHAVWMRSAVTSLLQDRVRLCTRGQAAWSPSWQRSRLIDTSSTCSSVTGLSPGDCILWTIQRTKWYINIIKRDGTMAHRLPVWFFSFVFWFSIVWFIMYMLKIRVFEDSETYSGSNDSTQWRRHGGGGGGMGAVAHPPPPPVWFSLFFLACLLSQSVMAMIVPLPHYEMCVGFFFLSRKQNVSIPSLVEQLFQGWREIVWLAQQ